MTVAITNTHVFLLVVILFLKIQFAESVEEGNNPETRPESDISSSTKKILRKVGRKAMDETCRLTEDKAKCEKEREEHRKANLADEADTKRRKEAKAARERKEDILKKEMENK
ncbi:MAG: hypothetical protein ACXVLQ_09310 [Bacteriovorax sp.]